MLSVVLCASSLVNVSKALRKRQERHLRNNRFGHRPYSCGSVSFVSLCVCGAQALVFDLLYFGGTGRWCVVTGTGLLRIDGHAHMRQSCLVLFVIGVMMCWVAQAACVL